MLPEIEDHKYYGCVLIPKRWRAPETPETLKILLNHGCSVAIMVYCSTAESSNDFHRLPTSPRDDQFNNNLHFLYAFRRLLHKPYM